MSNRLYGWYRVTDEQEIAIITLAGNVWNHNHGSWRGGSAFLDKFGMDHKKWPDGITIRNDVGDFWRWEA